MDGYAPFKVTLRQGMFRLAAEGVLPHTAQMHRRLPAQLAKARREGRFPDLIDTVREVHAPAAWPDVDVFVREMPDWFGLDRTAGQEHALHVAAEKDTPPRAADRLAHPGGHPGPGGPQLRRAVVRPTSSTTASPPTRAVALSWSAGDFDCSGEDIERDWGERTGCWSRTERVLLIYEQVRAYELPATEGRQGDPRWRAFADRYGFDPARPVQWEVEALEPAELQRLVLAAVAPYVDHEVLVRQVAREEGQRRALANFLDGWGTTGGGTRSWHGSAG